MSSVAERAGWRTPLVVLLCGTIVLLLSYGIRTSFGIYLQPMSADLGWGREVFALAIAVQNLMWGVAQPIAGAIADRYGAGRVVAVSGALYVVGLYLASQVTTPAEFTFSAGILIGIGLSGTAFPVVMAVVARSVSEKRRSLFLGIGAAGGSSGQVLVIPLGGIFLDGYGWSIALLMMAVMAMAMVPLAAALAGRVDPATNAEAPQGFGDALREAAAHRGFLYLNAGFFVCGFHVIFIATHLPAFIIDAGGGTALGATALVLIGFGNIAGSYLSGLLGGHFSKKYLLSGLYLARSVVIASFVLTPVTDVTIMVFAFSIGVLWLSTVPLTSGLVAQIFGVRYMATLFGIVFFTHQIGSFLGAWLGGYVYDRTGSYDIVWWVAVALGVAAALLHWPIDERPVARLAPAD
jgi:predicted MFS family arabinose efflux permease